ncbi:MAG: terminase family protein [Bryobacteraceae bacterium]|nr:terminase family protein [Bryobacteraceae bacterium]
MKTRFKGFSGPVGSGKSAALCQEAIRLAYRNPGRLGLLGAPTYPMLKDATQHSLLEILERARIPFDLNKSNNYVILTECEAKILFRSMEEYERLRGTNLAWFGLDELTYTAEAAWLRLEARLRDPKAKSLCGFAVWTPNGQDWVYQRFVEKRIRGYGTVLAKPFENRYLLEAVPDYYERLKHSYDTRFYEQEALGAYHESGRDLVYRAFQRSTNVRAVPVDPKQPLLWTLDFNVDPMCSLVAQRSGECVQVIDEIVIPRASTEEACEEFVRRFPQHAAGVRITGDASGNHRQTSGTTDYDMIRRFFCRVGMKAVSYHVPAANPRVADRVRLVNAKLQNAAGAVELLIHERCKELLKDFAEVRYREGTALIDKDSDPRRTHLSDALGYLIWQEFGPRPVVGEKNFPLF